MWQQPKAGWQASDYFNIKDYNRIKGNLNEIAKAKGQERLLLTFCLFNTSSLLIVIQEYQTQQHCKSAAGQKIGSLCLFGFQPGAKESHQCNRYRHTQNVDQAFRLRR